jgi:hypothetical protein
MQAVGGQTPRSGAVGDLDELLVDSAAVGGRFWIGAQAVNAERSILYFGGQGAGIDLLGLLAWAGLIAVLILLPVSRKLERGRERLAVAPA